MPLISVVIATYNDAVGLEKCLTSFQPQSFEDFELVIVNDGSADHIAEVVKRYDVKFVTYDENRGVSYARNEGIRKAAGAYIAFTDSDARVHPNWLQEIAKNLDEHTVLTGGSLTADGKHRNWGPRRRHFFGGSFLLPQFLKSCATGIYGANMVFPRSFFERCGYFSEFIRYGFDESDLIARGRGYRVRYVEKAIIFHDTTPKKGNALFMLVRNNLISKIMFYRGKELRKRLFLILYVLFRSFHAILLILRLRGKDAKLVFQALQDGISYCKHQGFL